MDLILTRNDYTKEGIFGILTDVDGTFLGVTLEHAFEGEHNYVPKVASGRYICVEHAPNRLNYTTYELQNVPKFQGKSVTGILIHIGNFNQDSDGCILIGSERNGGMIMGSKATFAKLRLLQKDVDSFVLTVI